MPLSKGVPDWTRRLDIRLVFFLSIALLPLGMISVFQTVEVSRAAERQSRLSLQLLTAQAASNERRLIEGALGSARALTASVGLIGDDPGRCQDFFTGFLDTSRQYSFAGFVRPDNTMICSSSLNSFDFSDDPESVALMAAQRPSVSVEAEGAVSRTSVIVVSQPVFDEGEFMGMIVVSLPHSALADTRSEPSSDRAIDLMTFNTMGQVLTSQHGPEELVAQLPRDFPLADLTTTARGAFTARDGRGRQRTYAVVPIITNSVYALGLWQASGPGTSIWPTKWSGAIFPFAMWITSLIVAYLALHRQVIRHVRKLQSEMRAFALHRILPDRPEGADLPLELAEMQRTLLRMSEVVLRDEAELENALHERNVLLKEVHHRVKNNLQLISSIMNMQLRKVTQAETKLVLRRLQDRVLGLAAIHRNLYQANNLTRVRADNLIRDVVNQLLAVGTPVPRGFEVERSLDKVTLYPDQAVPIALLATEAVTNAIKYMGAPPGARGWLNVRLINHAERRIELVVENSRGPQIGDAPESGTDGLGTRLIAAFAQQVGAAPMITQTDDMYRLSICIDAQEFLAPDEPEATNSPGGRAFPLPSRATDAAARPARASA